MATVTLVFLVATQSYTLIYFQVPPENQEKLDRITAALELIPEDASVRTTGFFAPRLAQRAELYDYKTNVTTDYLALDLRPGNENITQSTLNIFRYRGYEDVAYEKDLFIIMKYTKETEQ